MRNFLGVSILLVLFSLTTFAQLSTSSLIGTVSSPDGVLPGATVTVRDDKTGKEVTITTGDDGNFRVPNLEIGTYTVTVTSSGFKSFTAQQVRLEIGKDYNLPVALEVGGVSETVTITAGAEIVNSVDAQTNGIVSSKQITELPLLGRNPLNFVPLQAGVASNPSQNSTINGVRTSATNITIEGINVQDNLIRSNATDFSPARPIVDEVEEFTVTGQANADKGFGSGQIQFPIRRGGNEFRGSLYEYNRNSKFAANRFFNNAVGNKADGTPIVRRAFRNRNEFGGRISGPLPFLHFGEGGPVATSGKDKLFFFFLYQKTIDVQPASDLATVLTSNARNGLFTYTAAADDPTRGITAGQNVTVNILNPALGTGITAINPAIQSRFLGRIPTGNTSEAGDLRNTTGFRYNQSNNAEQTNYSSRIDYTINDRNSFKAIYRNVYQTVQRADIDDNFNARPLVDQPSRNPLLSLGLVSNITTNFSNEINAGYSFSNPSFLRNQAAPSAFIAPTLITNPDVTFLNQGRDTKTYNFQDNATFVAGNHSIRFGSQIQAIRLVPFNDAGIVPTFNLGTNPNTPQISTAQFATAALFPGGVPLAQRTVANNLLALLGGIVSSGNQSFNVESQTSGFVPGATNKRPLKTEIYGFYGSDQWRITPDLTINYGLRYDLYTALRSPTGLFLEPVIAPGQDPVKAILDPNGRYQFIGGNAGKANQFFKADKNNFGPNLSFAYAPKLGGGFGKFFGEGKTVFRGGYRISFINDEFVQSANSSLGNNQGLAFQNGAINSATGTTSLNGRADNLQTITAPVFNANRTFANNNTAAQSFFGTVFAIDPNIKTPSIKEYSFGIQRDLGFNTAIEARYVGTRSNNLLRAIDYNQVNITSNGFLADFNRARSNFLLTNNAACTVAQNVGCQALTVFPNLASGGLLTNSAITSQLTNGTPADLAALYIQNGLAGTVQFLPNPNTGVADLLGNSGRFRYNSLQIELRRRFAQGLQLQANYTFSKNLTNTQGSQSDIGNNAQSRFDPLLDNAQPNLENARSITDQTHKFNLNGVYELPFGKGKTFFNQGGITNFLLGGFQLSGILQIGSGAPVAFTDVRGTLNRSIRSNRQTALTNLSKQDLKNLVGVYRTDNGVFFINPTALGRDPKTGLTLPGLTGRGSAGFGQPTFQGQVFFNNAPGQTSSLERSIVNGPTFYTVDMSLIKRFSIGERYSFQIQADAFNLLNKTNFIIPQSYDINSTNFGRITNTFAPRVVQLAGRFNF
jgi:hypothetical protein